MVGTCIMLACKGGVVVRHLGRGQPAAIGRGRGKGAVVGACMHLGRGQPAAIGSERRDDATECMHPLNQFHSRHVIHPWVQPHLAPVGRRGRRGAVVSTCMHPSSRGSNPISHNLAQNGDVGLRRPCMQGLHRVGHIAGRHQRRARGYAQLRERYVHCGR